MHAHRRAGAFGIVPRDGIEDRLVLAVHDRKIDFGIFVRDARRVHSLARDQRRTELREDVDEIAIARGPRNRDMKLQIGLDTLGAAFARRGQCIERRANAGDVVGLRALRGEPCAFGFEADAQFENRQNITQRRTGRDLEPQPLARRFEHEAADAVARFDHLRRLQPRDRLANDSTAHVHRFHQLRFGRQLVAGLQRARFDLLGESTDDELGQIAGAAWGGGG